MSLFAITDAAAPDVAVEIAQSRVSAAALDRRAGRPAIVAHAMELLPPGALVPSLTGVNTLDRPTVMTALNRVLERVGRPKRVGIVVPDVVAKVSLVRFENVPARASDLAQLVRWQVRKAAPFPIEEAQVTYVRGLAGPEGQEYLVALARRAVIEEYESLCAEAGAHAGLVDLATFNVINAVVAGTGAPDGDWLLVSVASESASIAIMRGPQVIFFRSRSADSDGTIADLVHQTGMYYEDRLKGAGFSRVILAGAGHGAADAVEIQRSLEARVAAPLEMIDPTRAVALTDRISASPAFLESLAPLVGLLLRDREVAA